MDTDTIESTVLRIAGMGVLNQYGTHFTVQNQMDDQHGPFLNLLDALASICVRESSDAYSTALGLSASSVTVWVASNRTAGVPEEAIARLESAWDFMKSIQNDPVDARAAQDPSRYPHEQKLASFLRAQLHYSSSAIKARKEEASDIVAALERVFTHDCAIHKADCLGGGCVKQLTAQNTAFLHDVVDRVNRLRSLDTTREDELMTVIIEQTSLYKAIQEVLKDNRSFLFVRFIERFSKTPVRFFLRRLCWLGAARRCLENLASNAKYRDFFTLKLDIVPVPPPSPRHITLDFSEPSLFSPAESFYADRGAPPRTRPAQLEAEWRTCVLEPLRTHFGAIGANMNSEWAVSTLAYKHSECALLEFLVRHTRSCERYIGVSEPSCFPCWKMFIAYNQYFKTRPFHIRGCSGQSPMTWDCPHIEGAPAEMYTNLYYWMALSFADVVKGWRRAQDAA